MLRSVAKILKRKAFKTNVYQGSCFLLFVPFSRHVQFIFTSQLFRVCVVYPYHRPPPYARLFIGPIETLQYFEIVILDKATDCTFEIAIIL